MEMVYIVSALIKKKFQIDSINVIEPGEGYSNKKSTCLNTGINTATNTIKSINHGYSDGDIIHYMGVASTTDTELTGLSTNTDYVATVLDKDNLHSLLLALVILLVSSMNRRICKYHKYWRYWNSYIQSSSQFKLLLLERHCGTEFVAELQPKFLGAIDNVYISKGGVGYGVTNIQDFERNPIVTYSIGKDIQIKTIINNGSITEAIVLNRGKDFTSAPDVVVDGSGTGAVLTATLKTDGTIDKVIVIEVVRI